MCSFVDVPINFDSLEKAENEGKFMAETVNLSNEVIHNVALLTGSRESEELLSRKEAIICGLLIRITKLFQSFAKLVTQRDSVGATFLYRGITDCINQNLLSSYEINEIANTPIFTLFYPPNGHFSASDRLGQKFFVAKIKFRHFDEKNFERSPP